MKNTGRKRVLTYLSDVERAAAEKVAKEDGVTLSVLVRMAVLVFVSRAGK